MKTMHELTPQERDTAAQAFTTLIGTPPDLGFAPDRAWMEGYAAALSSATPAGGGLTFPQKEFDALLDHIYENGTTAEGVKRRAEKMIEAALAASPVPMSDTGAQEVKWTCAICRDVGSVGEPPMPCPMHTQKATAQEVAHGELDPRTALEQARAMKRYVESYNGQKWGGIDESPDRQNLAMALDHLEETAAMLMNVADRVASPPPQSGFSYIGPDGTGCANSTPNPTFAPQASQSAPGEAEVWQECDDNGKPIWSDSSFATSRDDLENPRPLYTHPATTHSAPVAGMTDEQIKEVVRRNGRSFYPRDLQIARDIISAALREKAGGKA